MKSYFEYPWNDEIKNRIIEFYNDDNSAMRTNQYLEKMDLKIERFINELSFNPKDIIADIGCGGDMLLSYLEEKYKMAFGYDISENLITKLNLENKSHKMIFTTYDGIHIKERNKFDKVFFLDVLEHAFEPDELMKEIYLSLKVNGILVIQVPTTGWLSELIMGEYHYGHLRYYDDKYLQKYLENVGFKVKSLKLFRSVPGAIHLLQYERLYKIISSLCNCIPYRIYPYFGSIMAIAEKV